MTLHPAERARLATEHYLKLLTMRFILADDHPLFAEALRSLIERNIPTSTLDVVGCLSRAHELLAAGKHCDLLVLDLQMPGMDGLDGVARTLSRFPGVPVVVVSGVATPEVVAQLLDVGAKGFFPKTMPASALAAGLQVVINGGTYVPATYIALPAPPAVTTQRRRIGDAKLTARESDVLALVAKGLSNKEIARNLDLQEITVKLHVRSIFRKLGVKNRVQAANAAKHFEPASVRPD